MKLGFVSAIVSELSLSEVLDLAVAYDYDCVEVMCWPPSKAERRYAGVTHINVTEVDDAKATEINQLCADKQVEISALGYYPNPLSADEAESSLAIEHIRRVIDAAGTLGLSTINSFIGRDPKLSVADNWPKMLDTWQPLVEYAEKHGIRIGIENCPMLFTADEWPGGKNLATTPAVWRRMFADFDSPAIGLNYDPSHMVWQQMDYLAPLREFANRLYHVHAKDVRLDRHRLDQVGIMAHPLEYHAPKLPGLGEVDWGKFVSVLGDCGYRGPVCVEVEDRAFEESLATRKASLEQSSRYLRQFITPVDE